MESIRIFLEQYTIFIVIVTSALGGLIRELIYKRKKRLAPKSWQANDGDRGLDLGIILGTFTACVVGTICILPIANIKLISVEYKVVLTFLLGLTSNHGIDILQKFGYRVWDNYVKKYLCKNGNGNNKPE